MGKAKMAGISKRVVQVFAALRGVMLQHRSTLMLPVENMLQSERWLRLGLGQSLNQVPIYLSITSLGHRANQRATQSCPLPGIPRTCPFGGFFHACPLPVQAKLTVGQPGDPFEQEAERVMSQPTDQIFQRLASACSEDEDKETLQTKGLPGQVAVTTSVPKIPPLVHEVLHSPGQPLDPATRAFMEPRLGYDFSQVRVHTDERAAESARAVEAEAYTVGRHIVFGAGRYNPDSVGGQRLLAHELTHVVQQQFSPAQVTNNPVLGEPANHFEAEAGRAENAVLFPRGAQLPPNTPPRITSRAQQPLIQRQTSPGGPPQLLPPLHLPTSRVELGSNESISATNPKLIQLAQAFKGLLSSNPQAYIVLSGLLNSAALMSSISEREERKRMREKMNTTRSVLETLGVPSGAVTIESPYSFSSTSGGVISADLYKAPKPLPALVAPQPIPGQTPGAPSASPSPSLSELLTFKFKAGPLEIAAELPKSVSAKLPLPLSASKTLVFDLKAETSGTFSFSVTLNGLPHVRVSAKSQLSVDKEKGTSGRLGLEIQITRTVCSASNPEALKAKIISSGEKLKKALQELETAQPDERLEKLIDIASAIGDMYDAVDKSKSACKETPAATFEFGLQGPLKPSEEALSEPDPTKRPTPFVGGSITIPF